MFPDFLIVGAAKCGTSTLHTLLSEHPQLCLSTISEPGFFSGDNCKVRSLEEYRAAYFKPQGSQICGEASTMNLYAPGACEAIKSSAPSARIIILVRKPWDAVHSWYYQICRYRDDVAPFETLASKQISEGKIVDRAGALLAFDLDRYTYVPQISRFVAAFGAERVLVANFHQFVADPKAVLDATTNFLGVAPFSNVGPLEKVNAAAAPASRVARAGLALASRIKDNAVWQVVLPPSLRRRVRASLMRRAWKTLRRPPMPAHLQQQLVDYYERDLMAMRERFGVDLLVPDARVSGSPPPSEPEAT
jgi:hypothetical protein